MRLIFSLIGDVDRHENLFRFLIAAILVLLMPSLASSETQEAGPYTISFDINTNLNYEVLHDRPMQTESATVYRLLIKTDDSAAASISVTKYNEVTLATIAVHKSIMPMDLIFHRDINVTLIDDMTIDNQPGFLVSGVKYIKGNEVNFYEAMYWLKSVDCDCGPIEFGKIRVDVFSTYSKEITIGLLNSLRIA